MNSMAKYDKAIAATAACVSTLMEQTGADKARCAVEVEGLRVEVSLGNWDTDDEDSDE